MVRRDGSKVSWADLAREAHDLVATVDRPLASTASPKLYRGSRTPGLRGIALLLGAALAAACAGGPIESLHPMANIPPFIIRDSAPADSFDLTFLGTSGFLIKRDGHAVMTGPLFSNPGFFWHILFRFPIHQRTGFIDRVFSDTALRHGADVTASILIGHSHYDHLMDVPYVAEHYALHAQIYGSPTMGHILAGDSLLHHRTGHSDSLDRVRVIDEPSRGTNRFCLAARCNVDHPTPVRDASSRTSTSSIERRPISAGELGLLGRDPPACFECTVRR